MNKHDKPTNPQSKREWIDYGKQKEQEFWDLCMETSMFPGIKRNTEDPVYYPEFIFSGRYLDLKYQETPLFKAKELYGIDPTYAITYNVQDRDDCTDKYSPCDNIFWVKWARGYRYGTRVRPRNGLWYMSYEKMVELTNTAEVITYQNRIDDEQGNAASSFVLNLKDLVKITPRPPKYKCRRCTGYGWFHIDLKWQCTFCIQGVTEIENPKDNIPKADQLKLIVE